MNGNAIPMTTAMIADSIFWIAVPYAMSEQGAETYNARFTGGRWLFGSSGIRS